MIKEDLITSFIQTRSDEAFEKIYSQYHNLVFVIINNIVHDNEVSKELTSDTFFRMYKSIDTFKIGSSFTPWISKIARNLAINYLNRDKDKNVVYNEDIVLSTEELTNDSFSLPDINTILSGKELKIVKMKVIENYTYREICDSLEINLSDAYRSYQSGIKKIKETMKK